MIRRVDPKDASAICDIYNHYVINTVISFEEQPVSVIEMEKRIRDTVARYPWLVLEEGEEIIGYAYANKFRERSAYRFSSEVSIYLKTGRTGKGLGTLLFSRLIDETKNIGTHALLSSITLPNERSVAIHEKFGFEKAAHFKEVGFKFGKWNDVGYWELIFK